MLHIHPEIAPSEPRRRYDEAMLRAQYRRMLTRLCQLVGTPEADKPAALAAGEPLTVDGVPVTFQLEPWSAFIKIFVDVGLPSPGAQAALHRFLLSSQLYQPAPFSLIPAIHPDTDHVVLYGCSPLPQGPESERKLLGFVRGCVQASELLRPRLGRERVAVASAAG